MKVPLSFPRAWRRRTLDSAACNTIVSPSLMLPTQYHLDTSPRIEFMRLTPIYITLATALACAPRCHFTKAHIPREQRAPLTNSVLWRMSESGQEATFVHFTTTKCEQALFRPRRPVPKSPSQAALSLTRPYRKPYSGQPLAESPSSGPEFEPQWRKEKKP